MTTKLFALLALLSCTLAAQIIPSPRYSGTTGDVSLTAAGTTLTIQQPAVPVRSISFESATVYCSVACTVTQAQLGAAATTTAGSFTVMAPHTRGASALLFTASNVGTGQAIGGAIHLGAGQSVVIDLSSYVITAAPNANYSISVSSITGTANITVISTERL